MPFLRFIFAIVSALLKIRKRTTKNAVFLYTDKTLELQSKEEKFAYDIANLEHERITDLVKDLELMKFFKKEWGRSFKKDKKGRNNILSLLMDTWSEGSVNLLFQYTHLDITVKDMIAFDCARFAELIRIALFLKLLEEEEAWGFLFLNAQRVQDSFDNWDDFKHAYFKGASLYEFDLSESKKYKTKIRDQKRKESKVKEMWVSEALFSHIKPIQNSIEG